MVFSLSLITLGTWIPSHAQQANSFVGRWFLRIELAGNPFDYEIRATPSPGGMTSNGTQSAPASMARGGGGVLGALNFNCTNTCREIGFGWRHTPLTGLSPTGVALSFELQSPVAPGTFVLQGDFVDANTVQGKAILLADVLPATNPNTVDPDLNRVVTVGTFTAFRLE
jgi:hypothetical protein